MNTPAWMEDLDRPKFPPLTESLKVDAVVIGGGITGVTAAYLLKKGGATVALIEKEQCGSGDTGHTTAHLTYATDTRLSELVRSFGRERAEAAWDAGLAAMYQIHQNVTGESLDCDFHWTPGYLHASLEPSARDERSELQQDAEYATDFGFPATYLESVPLVGRPGVRFADQAIFHPLKYLTQLAQKIPGEGCYVFEHTPADEVHDEPLSVRAHNHRISCGRIVVATHAPLAEKAGSIGATLLQTKLAAYTSYAVWAKLPPGAAPVALYWDTTDPYYYLRIERMGDFDVAIFGGQDHKTGQDDRPEHRFGKLEERLLSLLPQAELKGRWSGQVIESNDGLPYIGETSPRRFVATGFAGNGMTFGTLGGMMARDWVLGRKNPWSDLFDVGRKNLWGGAWDYVKENLSYPYYLIKDRLSPPENVSLDSILPGEGKLVQLDGERVAAYRNESGEVTCVSAACPHMGCLVHWNTAEKTWDCPCHGSRFHPTGEVLAGPAESPLEEMHAKVEVH